MGLRRQKVNINERNQSTGSNVVEKISTTEISNTATGGTSTTSDDSTADTRDEIISGNRKTSEASISVTTEIETVVTEGKLAILQDLLKT